MIDRSELYDWRWLFEHFWMQVLNTALIQEFFAPSMRRSSLVEWKWHTHIRWWYAQEWFWGQIAIAAVLHVLHSHDRLLAEVMPIKPPWDEPRWWQS